MRWTTVFWLLMSLLIISSASGSTVRQKRNLSFIKRLLLKHTGSTQYKCKDTPQKPPKAYEIIVVPNRRIVVEPASKITRRPQKNNDNTSFLKTIRQIITSATFQEFSQDLSELIDTMRSSVSSSRVTDRIVENVSEPPKQQVFQESLKAIPVVEVSRPPLKEEMVFERPKMINDLPSLDNFVDFIVKMPRRYSYEQIKGPNIETFTLDDNSNVIVTHRSKTMPRPAHIDDRIKEVILRVPLSVKSNDNRLVNIQNKLTLKPSEYSDVTDNVPTHKMEDNVNVNNANIQTRYMYKQNTDNGVLNYGGTSFVTFGQQDEKVYSKVSPSISAYTGKPIIVSPLSDLTNNINSITLSEDNNQTYTNVENNAKDNTRGDIPD